MVGKSSTIACAIAAPEKDDTFEMYLNKVAFSKLPEGSHWRKFNFKRYEKKEENGTVHTAIVGYATLTAGHNNTMINCTSNKYKGHVARKIILRPANSTDNKTGKTETRHQFLTKINFLLTILVC
jgi:hypothetical protein